MIKKKSVDLSSKCDWFNWRIFKFSWMSLNNWMLFYYTAHNLLLNYVQYLFITNFGVLIPKNSACFTKYDVHFIAFLLWQPSVGGIVSLITRKKSIYNSYFCSIFPNLFDSQPIFSCMNEDIIFILFYLFNPDFKVRILASDRRKWKQGLKFSLHSNSYIKYKFCEKW